MRIVYHNLNIITHEDTVKKQHGGTRLGHIKCVCMCLRGWGDDRLVEMLPQSNTILIKGTSGYVALHKAKVVNWGQFPATITQVHSRYVVMVMS